MYFSKFPNNQWKIYFGPKSTENWNFSSESSNKTCKYFCPLHEIHAWTKYTLIALSTGRRIHRQYSTKGLDPPLKNEHSRLQRRTTPTNECPVYDTKPSAGHAPGLQMGECEIRLYFHCSQVHSDSERYHLIGSHRKNCSQANDWC